MKFAINLELYIAIPRKLRNPDCVIGAGAFLIAYTLSGSGKILFAEKTNPKNELIFREHTLVSVEGKTSGGKSLKHVFKSYIVIRLHLAENNDVIADV